MSDDASLPQMVLLVRTQGKPEDIAGEARTIAAAADSTLFANVRLLSDSFHAEVGTVEKGAMIVSLMGASAVLLAAPGLMGLVAYEISQKMQEIAIRLALGARKAHVIVATLRHFVGPVALGLMIGAGVAAAASRLLRRILNGVSGLDLLSYIGAIGLLAAGPEDNFPAVEWSRNRITLYGWSGSVAQVFLNGIEVLSCATPVPEIPRPQY